MWVATMMDVRVAVNDLAYINSVCEIGIILSRNFFKYVYLKLFRNNCKVENISK